MCFGFELLYLFLACWASITRKMAGGFGVLARTSHFPTDFHPLVWPRNLSSLFRFWFFSCICASMWLPLWLTWETFKLSLLAGVGIVAIIMGGCELTQVQNIILFTISDKLPWILSYQTTKQVFVQKVLQEKMKWLNLPGFYRRVFGVCSFKS